MDLVLFAFENGTPGDIFVQKAPACTIGVLARAVREIFNAKNDIRIIGIRHGEKMYETLLTKEECAHAIDMGDFYRVPADKRELNYEKYFTEGAPVKNTPDEFNSENTTRLSVEEVKKVLLSQKFVQERL